MKPPFTISGLATEEVVSKIKAAVDSRIDSNFLIMACTDACATQGFEAAIERAHKFSEAGADILFVEAVTTEEEIRKLPSVLSKQQLMNMVIGGKTPIFGAEELGDLGYGFVLYANTTLQSAVAGMQKPLESYEKKSALTAPQTWWHHLLNASV